MKNWSENIEWSPKEVAKPSSEAELQALIQAAVQGGRQVRIIGTGHSFEPLSVTDDLLINLDNWQGLIEVDEVEKTAVVKSGTKLNLLGQLLYDKGLAQENLGDIDQQSIAGSISTGTHGTGTAFGNLSTQVIGMRFVNGKGEIVDCSINDKTDLFKAMQISLGSMGVITQLKLQLVDAYKLELVKDKSTLDEILNQLDSLNANNRNFEFYWLPYTNVVQTKTTNIGKGLVDKSGIGTYFDEVVMENWVFKLFCDAAKMRPSLNTSLNGFLAKFISHQKKTKYSHQVYATPRYVKFNEMEYNVPLEAYKDVMKDLVKCVEKNKFNIHFPVENRFVKQDDIYLSPAYKRDSAYIAAHVYKGKEYKKYFDALEEIYIAYDGRPHWGKMHTRRADYFSKVYPKWNDFLKHRNEQDPEGLFLSPYLKDVFALRQTQGA